MKKIVFLCTFVFAAISINAATIQWGNGVANRILTPTLIPVDYPNGVGNVYAQLVFVPSGMTYIDVLGFEIGDSVTGVPDYGFKTVATTPGTPPFNLYGTIAAPSHSYEVGKDEVAGFKVNTGSQFFIRLWTSYGGEDFYMDVFSNGAAIDDTFLGTFWTTDANDTTITSDTFTWDSGVGGLYEKGGNWKPVVPIPEPATMALVGIGIVAFGLRRRRK